MHPPNEKYLAFKTSSVSLDIEFCFLVNVPSSFHFFSWERAWKTHLSSITLRWKESSPVLIEILSFYNIILLSFIQAVWLGKQRRFMEELKKISKRPQIQGTVLYGTYLCMEKKKPDSSP